MQNRLSGLVVALFGLAIVFLLIPNQTEPVDYGWLRPATLPAITAVIIIISGLVQLLFPKGRTDVDVRAGLRVLFFFAIGIADLWLMHTAGFAVAAPLLLLVLMLTLGERRLLWLITGVILLPASIWFIVDYLLNRPLP